MAAVQSTEDHSDDPLLERRAIVGRILRDRRLARELSIEDAAAESGVSHVTWTRIERGQAVKPNSYAAPDRFLNLAIGTTAGAIHSGDLSPIRESMREPDSRVDEVWILPEDSGDPIADDEIAERIDSPGSHYQEDVPRAPELDGTYEQVRQSLPLLSITELRAVKDQSAQLRHAKIIELLKPLGLAYPEDANTWRMRLRRVSFKNHDQMWRLVHQYNAQVNKLISSHEALTRTKRAYLQSPSRRNRKLLEQLTERHEEIIKSARALYDKFLEAYTRERKKKANQSLKGDGLEGRLD